MKETNLVLMGQPSLYQKSLSVERIDTEVTNIIDIMRSVLKQKKGVGLAAPQIGYNRRIILFGFENNIRYPEQAPLPITALINPEYEVLDSAVDSAWEGCLSVPGIRGLVERYKTIKYYGLDQNGNKVSAIAAGFVARIIQHEIDHLDGIIFPFRVHDLKYLAFESVINKQN